MQYNSMQLYSLHPHFDSLQTTHGDPALSSIYGAGCIVNPKVCFVFMNPTGRNLSAKKDREGLRAPWLGFKQVWQMFWELGLISTELYLKTQATALSWSPAFVEELFEHLAKQWVYITNLAKCTQPDAAALKDSVFKAYLPLMHEEISIIKPERIITFGNQVTSVLLGRNISVSQYENAESFEKLTIGNETYKIYPCWYPVGIGYRNMGKAVARIKAII